ncbi:FMN reductase [Labrys sp. KNU-23]|uniref:FMN reductase n=1 Tax=Labrys sp. KNU-23 TaxID=2789216 RepID=UPI0011EBEC9A|nr:FMN reductase [Labrys sp. KNU-23]QEN86445.1 FMN reductase [Labrys sp. KNU-23]
MKIVGISGSVRRPSRTTALVQNILDGLGDLGAVRLLELVDEAPHLFSALTAEALSDRAANVVQLVENADLLVVGSPVYRASYTGALKHLFDLVDYRALRGTPVVLAATGGTSLHGLMTEHQLRPLFGFFGARTIPTAVYALDVDFDDYELTSQTVRERIDRAVIEARQQLTLPALTSRPVPIRLSVSA